MGDRTYVRLQILESQLDAALPIIANTANEDYDVGSLHEFCFEEVNYGDLEFLEELAEAGIAYDSNWDAGSEYEAGSEYCRFTCEGDAIVKQIYNDGWGCPVSELMDRLDDIEKLRQYILEQHEKLLIIDMDENQVEYGKRYRAKQLIAPGG